MARAIFIAFKPFRNVEATRIARRGRRGADLRVSVPSRFMRDWVATHYADRLRSLWSSENPEIHTVEVIVDTTQA